MRINYHILFILILFCIRSATISAQYVQMDEDKEEVSRKGMWYMIPEANLWFGPYSSVELAPQIAYHLSDRLSVGSGLNYNFYKELETYYTPGYSTHMIGARAFTRLTIIKNAEQWMPVSIFSDLFIHLELQAMNLERERFYAPSYPEDGRFWSEQVYIGAGLTQNINPYVAYSLLLLWDLNRNIYTPFGNPVYRIGLNVYLGGREEE